MTMREGKSMIATKESSFPFWIGWIYSETVKGFGLRVEDFFPLLLTKERVSALGIDVGGALYFVAVEAFRPGDGFI
jgi:hypothetical protein